MGLNSVIKSAVAKAFTAIGASADDGIQQSISYYQVTGIGAYDPDTGLNAPTETLSTFDAVVYHSQRREIDGIKVDINETRALFQQTEIAFTPVKDDRVVIGSDRFNVIDVHKDPVDATWVLHLRGE